MSMMSALEKDRATADDASCLAADLLHCLTHRGATLPARWLYDERGSELFEDITRLDAYYPTRTETALLRQSAGEIADMAGPGRVLVEFGAGSATKTPLLIEAVAPVRYIPIDISGEMLHSAAARLSGQFPDMKVIPVEADFGQPVRLPSGNTRYRALGFFPGSTIGNLTPDEATDLLRQMRGTLGKDAMLLIGMDQRKDRDILHRAYDDPEGVTADFNLNLLHRINRELDLDIPVHAFAHEARWNEEKSRIEMHLVARREVRFRLPGQEVMLRSGESLHTENSHKYGARDGDLLLRAGGWEPVRRWTDSQDHFALVLARATAERDR